MERSEYIFYGIIGWMKYYEGCCAEDTIEGGGNYPAEQKHEACNFKDISGKVYGYVQPSGDSIKIERIGGDLFEDKDKIDDVLVIWVAPGFKGRVIVGWYEHATVYRNVKMMNGVKPRSGIRYNVVAKSSDCVLIPYEMRDFVVPQGKGYTGQSNVWYADSETGIDFSKRVKDYVANFSITAITDQDITDTIVVEGGKRLVKACRYERDARARAICIREKGVKCSVCGMSFENVYGEIGKGFIHVHHMVPVSMMDGPMEYDAKGGLVPVCPNCHAMLHRKEGMVPYTPEELKEIMRKVKK